MKKITKLLFLSALAASMTACTGITDVTSSTSSTVDAVTPDVTVNEFVSKRFVAIRNEAAKGSGENLNALAELMGKQDSRAFSKNIKTNFDDIFGNIKLPTDIIAKIEAHSNLTKA